MKTEAVVKNIMTTNLITISRKEPIAHIQSLFLENDFHHLPVVEKGSRLVGIVSKEDFYKVFLDIAKASSGSVWADKKFKNLVAEDIMTKDPIQLDPDDTVGLAADLLLGNKFHSLPIVEDGELIGILTSHDVIAYCFK
jgi:CBS domain-containing protein